MNFYLIGNYNLILIKIYNDNNKNNKYINNKNNKHNIIKIKKEYQNNIIKFK